MVINRMTLQRGFDAIVVYAIHMSGDCLSHPFRDCFLPIVHKRKIMLRGTQGSQTRAGGNSLCTGVPKARKPGPGVHSLKNPRDG